MKNSNPCGKCTNCCTGTLVRAREEDMIRWKKEQRYDIILCLDNFSEDSIFLIHKKHNEECIFLGEKGCTIYETRPITCRKFPSSEKQKKKYNCLL